MNTENLLKTIEYINQALRLMPSTLETQRKALLKVRENIETEYLYQELTQPARDDLKDLLNLCNALNNRTDHRFKFSVIQGKSVLMSYHGFFRNIRQEFYGGLDKIEREVRNFLLEF